jgi:hypothetical protein
MLNKKRVEQLMSKGKILILALGGPYGEPDNGIRRLHAGDNAMLTF